MRLAAVPLHRALLTRAVPLVAHADLLVQLQPVYAALEVGWERLVDHAAPEVRAVLDPELCRSRAVLRDLDDLASLGVDVDHTVTPQARAYAERVTRCRKDWLPGLLTHHHARYVADLAAATVLASGLARTHGLPPGRATAVFGFPAHPLPLLQARYRTALHGLGLDPEQARRVALEAELAQACNRAVHEVVLRRHASVTDRVALLAPSWSDTPDRAAPHAAGALH